MITALIEAVDRNTALLVEAIARQQPPVVTAREIVREVRVEPPPQEQNQPDSPPVASVAFPVANATDMQQGMQQPSETYKKPINVAKKPREYILEYLDTNPEIMQRLSEDNTFGYRELAAEISACYDMNFDHTTVYRTVRKHIKRKN